MADQMLWFDVIVRSPDQPRMERDVRPMTYEWVTEPLAIRFDLIRTLGPSRVPLTRDPVSERLVEWQECLEVTYDDGRTSVYSGGPIRTIKVMGNFADVLNAIAEASHA